MTKTEFEALGFNSSGLDTIGETIERVEVPNPVKRKPGRYPQAGWTPTVTVEKIKPGACSPHFSISGPVSAFASLYRLRPELRIKRNSEQLAEFYSDEMAEWRGGTYLSMLTALEGHANLDSFEAARDNLRGREWIQKLIRSAEAEAPRRKKVWGDEGQWVEARRYEPEPFESFKRLSSESKTLGLLVDMGQNSGVSSDRIARFGAMVWAMVDILESNGVSVNLDLRYLGAKPSANTATKEVTVHVKKSGEYLSPSQLAAVLTPNFFRRVIFSAWTVVEDIRGNEIYSSLGRSVNGGPAAYEKGTLRLSIDDDRDMDSLADIIIKEVIQAHDKAA